MTFEPIEWPGEDDDQPVPHEQQRDEDTPSLIARFSRYLAARRTAGLGHRNTDTDETERLWP
jgi:hypothetical protein